MYGGGAFWRPLSSSRFYPGVVSNMHRYSWDSSILYGMVVPVDDDLTRSDTDCTAERRDEGRQTGPEDFQQLTLAATVTGPGKRTEDYYERGAKLKIKGERGVFTYKHASVSKTGLVSLHLSGEGGSRAVRPDQVAPIRKRRSR